jgi:hypothetical protein
LFTCKYLDRIGLTLPDQLTLVLFDETKAISRPIGLCAEPTMSGNLLRFRGRVQQLLVRVIFLSGISDSNNPISHVTFRGANHVADAERLFEQN